jgi:HIV Tat-specific factor 1
MARGAPFPREVEEFDQDDRVSYDTQEQKWLLVDDSNEEWEFSEATKSWFQPVSLPDAL